jgi:hypothetical protein
MFKGASTRNVVMPTISKSLPTERQGVYLPQDIIKIHVPAGLGTLNPLETYLKFNILIQPKRGGASGAKAMPDPAAGGAWALIDRVEIYTGTGTHLETIQGIAELMGTMKLLVDNRTLKHKDELMEGLSPQYGINADQNIAGNQYFECNLPAATTQTTAEESLNAVPVQVILPMYLSGVLYASKKAFPLSAVGGLDIRIHTHSAQRALVGLRTCTGFGLPLPASVYPAVGGAGNGTGLTNSTFSIFNYIVGGVPAAAVAVGNVVSGLILDLPTDGGPAGSGMNPLTAANGTGCPFVVGEELIYVSNTPANVVCGPITSIQNTAGRIQLNFANLAAAVAASAQHNRGYVDTISAAGANAWDAEYQIQDVQFIVGTIQTGAGYLEAMNRKVSSKAGLSLEYPSWNLYRNNIEVGVQATSIYVPCTANRAKSIIVNPMPILSETIAHSNFSPVTDGISSYQFIQKNTLVPDRKVPVDRFNIGNTAELGGWNIRALKEIQHACQATNWTCRNLCEVSDRFTIGRQLARPGHSFDANENPLRLNLEFYQAVPVAQKLVHSNVLHLRRLIVTPGSQVVET